MRIEPIKRAIRMPVRLLKKILSKTITYYLADRHFNGVTIKLPLDVRKFFPPFDDTKYEVEEWEALFRFGKPGQTFIDIGANIGIITVAMSMIAGHKGRVIACEPDPMTYRRLQALLKLNRCKNAVSMQVLMMDACKESKFYLSDAGGLGVMSSIINKDRGLKEISLPGITIDKLLDEERCVDYIKIDAEGSDLKILRGANWTIKKHRPIVQVEVHGQYMPKLGDSAEELFLYMADRQYQIINIPTWSEISIEAFMKNTHCHVRDPITLENMGLHGYGQIVCIPSEKKDILNQIIARKCPACGA
jgi:FkbM family methyltransferase